MNQIYDFNAYSPPIVTAWTLEQARRQRAFERQLLLLSIAALLLETCIGAAPVLLFGFSFTNGLICAVLLCVLQIGSGLILTAFLHRRKQNRPYFS